MADDKLNQEGQAGSATIQPEDWSPEPDSDWVDWMDRPAPSYEGKPPVYQADLTGEPEQPLDEQQAKQKQIEQRSMKPKPKQPPPEKPTV